MIFKLILLIFLSLTLSLAEVKINYANAFQNKDYFEYDLYWSFLKVGSARLEFEESYNKKLDEDVYKIIFSVKTGSVIEKIYPVNNKIISTLKIPGLLPLSYSKIINEGGKKENILVDFLWKDALFVKSKNGVESAPMRLLENTLDSLSLILSISQNRFSLYDSFTQDITDGGNITKIKSTLKKNLEISTSLGYFDTNEIAISTSELSGVFEKSPNAKLFLYLTEDNPSIPIKLKVNVMVGDFSAILKEGSYKGKPVVGVFKSEPKLNKGNDF